MLPKRTAQTTVSKFFTSTGKEKTSTGIVNCIQVTTDIQDTFPIVKKSVKNPLNTFTISNEDAPKCKMLCNTNETIDFKCSPVQKCEDAQATMCSIHSSMTATTSSKLKDFEYGENYALNLKRDVWKHKSEPLDSCTCSDIEIMKHGSSDSDDGDILSPAHKHIKRFAFRLPETFFLSSNTCRPATSSSQTHIDTCKTTEKYTPLEHQFVDIKAQYPDAVLFVECGYKYRFFGEDAEIAARILNIYCHIDHNLMTASIPVHRLFVHVRRIVAAGYKVGIVKQTETLHLKAAGNNKSGPFNRQLSALYTKSTLIGEDPLYDSETNCETSWQSNHYLLCVCGQQEIESSASCQLGLVCVDPSTGEILYDEFTNSTAYSELETRIAHLQPVEILIPSDTSQHLMAIFQGIAALRKTDDDKIRLEIIDSDVFVPTNAVTTLTQFYSNDQSKLKDVLNLPKLVINCLAALSIYLKSFHLERVLTFTRFSQRSTHMYINKKSLLSLEIVSNSCDATEKGSLYWVLNHTCTKFGARLLRKWLAQPLLVVGEIQARLDAVQELMNGNLDGLKSMRQIMSKLPDLERGLCSIFHRKCSLTEFCIVTSALEKLRKEICCIFVPATSSLLQTLLTGIPEYLESITWFCSQINEAAARENDKCNIFVDMSKFPVISDRQTEIRKVEMLIQSHLEEIQLILKQPVLKYVTVMQTEFLIEVKNSQFEAVPSSWTLISSTKTVSRFHTPYLVKHYRKLNELREQLLLDVNVSWQEFLDQFSTQFTRYQRAVTALATLDCLMSLAKIANHGSFCRPKVDDDSAHINIQQGRHPIINALNYGQEQFVPNNTNLNANNQRVMVITGPNMGGKSSYIRQVALISIMAQIGSFVPAQSASLGVIDAIYTRMGASDEIFQGRSTFMVELQETEEILTQATDKSLVVLDELGRGTSTYDGVAIAHATLEHFIQRCQCLVLFVTHFPLMSEFHQIYTSQVRNFHMAFLVNEDRGDMSRLEPVTFLYHLSEGAAKESYGLNVARLAEISASILNTASKKSCELEKRITERVWRHHVFASLYRATNEDVNEVLRMCKQSSQVSHI